MNNYIYTPYVSPASELYHHGIKGQKWGVRRYQNEDGTYTAEGRRHYGIGAQIAGAVRGAATAVANTVKSPDKSKSYSVRAVEKRGERTVSAARAKLKSDMTNTRFMSGDDKRTARAQARNEYSQAVKGARKQRFEDMAYARNTSIFGSWLGKQLIGGFAGAGGTALIAAGKPKVGGMLIGAGLAMGTLADIKALSQIGNKYVSRYVQNSSKNS